MEQEQSPKPNFWHYVKVGFGATFGVWLFLVIVPIVCLVLVMGGVMVFAFAASMFHVANEVASAPSPTPEFEEAPAVDLPLIAFEDGMTYADACEAVEADGAQLSSDTLSNGAEIALYRWDIEDYIATAIFIDKSLTEWQLADTSGEVVKKFPPPPEPATEIETAAIPALTPEQIEAAQIEYEALRAAQAAAQAERALAGAEFYRRQQADAATRAAERRSTSGPARTSRMISVPQVQVPRIE